MTSLVAIAFLLAALGLCVLLSGVFSGAETAAITANEAELRQNAEDGHRGSRRALAVLEDRRRVVSIVLVGTNLSTVMAALICDRLFEMLGEWTGAELVWFSALNFLVVTPLLLVLGEIVPKHFCRIHADAVITRLAGFLQISGVVFVPVLDLCTFFVNRLMRPFGFHATPRAVAGKISVEDIKEVVGDSGTSGSIERSEQVMISRIFDLRETIVREVMRPLPEVVALKLSEVDLDDVRRIARETGFSRFPVFRQRSFKLEGYIDIYDVLRRANGNKNVEDFILEPFYCPETMSSSDLLKTFLRNKMPAAIVVDEHGGTVGWVTREDILEEVVGEIEDEFDPHRPQDIEVLSETKLRLAGSIDIDDLNRLFELALPKDEDFDTLGGLIFTRLGRVAEVGDHIEEKGIRLTVEEVRQVRIDRVVAELQPPVAGEDAEENRARGERWRRRLALIKVFQARAASHVASAEEFIAPRGGSGEKKAAGKKPSDPATPRQQPGKPRAKGGAAAAASSSARSEAKEEKKAAPKRGGAAKSNRRRESSRGGAKSAPKGGATGKPRDAKGSR